MTPKEAIDHNKTRAVVCKEVASAFNFAADLDAIGVDPRTANLFSLSSRLPNDATRLGLSGREYNSLLALLTAYNL